MNELAIRPSDIDLYEVIEGELMDDGIIHELCGEFHNYVAEGNDLIICCGCGHAHRADESCIPDGPCGSYLCCIS